jgi:hypothetical protein
VSPSLQRLAIVVLVAFAIPVGSARQAAAQGWAADVYLGGTRYDALATRTGAVNLIGNIRYQGGRGTFSYLSAAAPLAADATPWTAAGIGGRLELALSPRLVSGIELTTHGYAYRDKLSERSGAGVTLSGLPFLTLQHASGSFELQGGRRQHLQAIGGETSSRGVYEVAGRSTLKRDGIELSGEARWVHDDTASYPYAGIQLSRSTGRVRYWGSIARWFAGQLHQTAWSVGVSIRAGALGEVWSGVRREASEPLYGNPVRHSWNVGFSRPLGGQRALPLAPEISDGRVLIRLTDRDIPSQADSAPFVAGDFTGWEPMPMRRSDGTWRVELPLGSGVYRMAFRTGSGDWFVPESYPGRIDDGMGGHLAVIVVP